MSPQSMVHSPEQTLEEKLTHVKNLLSDLGRVVVAFSGGVDSTLLAKLAREKPQAIAMLVKRWLMEDKP